MDAIWHRSGSFVLFYLSSLWDNFKWNVNQNTKFPLKKIRYGHFVQAGVSLTHSENNAQGHTTIWTREMGGISFWDMDKVMTHRRNLWDVVTDICMQILLLLYGAQILI